jgi:hypothetical protein
MSETLKTIGLVAAGAALAWAAWSARPAPRARGGVDDAGQHFFPGFKDPLAAASLEILRLDEDSGAPTAFKVARHDGVWSLPSRENYPADAEKQFARAAAEFIGLVKGTSVSDKPSEHELFGTVDPAAAPPGTAGAGTRVALAGDDGRSLASLIIGKEVRESKGQRYVRVPGQDRVYLCKVDAAKFSTNFDDWIEKDLLKLEPGDLHEVVINDYSIDEVNQRLVQGDLLRLTYDPKKYDWTLEGLSEGEKLVPSKLNELRSAVDDLKIADVRRKPAGLSAELRTEDTLRLDAEAVQSLAARGFLVHRGQLLSNQGETIVRAKDGVQYRLRFGEVVPLAGGGQGRYLFITAEFNEDLVPKPELAAMPDLAALGIDLPEDEPGEPADEGAEGDEPPSGEAAQPSVKEAMEMARRKIDEDNAAKQAEHDRTLEAGRQRARDLNARFADWYFVISDETYGKIRLRREDIVEAAAAAPAES